MSSHQKLLNGLEEIGIKCIQVYIDTYIDLVNQGEKSFGEAHEELVEIERVYRQAKRDSINLHIANFPFLKTIDDFDFGFQPEINKKEVLELNNLGFLEKYVNVDDTINNYFKI